MKYFDLTQKDWFRFIMTVELPAECMLGLPTVSYEKGDIKLSFFPHRVRLENGSIAVYPAEYELCVRAPYQHIETYRKLDQKVIAPIGLVDPNRLSTEINPSIKEIYALLDKILDSRSWGMDEADLVKEYQNKLERMLDSLGLSALGEGVSL